MDVSTLSPDMDLPEPTDDGSTAPLEPWQESNDLAASAIAEIAAEFDASADEDVEVPAATDEPDAAVEAKTEAPAEKDPEERGLARLVEREVTLRATEEKLSLREKEIASKEARLSELEEKSASYEGDFHDQLRLKPTEALKAAGHDPDHVVRLYLAEKFQREGKPVPDKLQREIERAETQHEIRTLRQQTENYQRQQASQQFVAGIEAGARTFIEQGISKDAPTVALVAAKQPARVYREIMDEISRDAQARSGKDTNAPILTYADAAKRVEARWAEFRGLFDASPAPDASIPPTKTPAPTVTKQGASSPALKPPARPLAARKPATQAELEQHGIDEAIAEFKRSEAAKSALVR